MGRSTTDARALLKIALPSDSIKPAMARFRKGEVRGSGAPAARAAVVIGRWADDTALLRVDDGTTREVPVPEPLREMIDVGSRARVGANGGGDVEWDLDEEGRSRPVPVSHRRRRR